jgi:uncharacterized protein
MDLRVARFRSSAHGAPGREGSRSRRESIDLFVHLAHQSPIDAIALMERHRSLSMATSSWGETAMQAASHLGHRELLARLVECGVSLDVFAATAMGEAAAATAMMAAGPKNSCGIHDLPLLHFAVMSRDIETVEALIATGAPLCPSTASLSPLHSAAGIGSKPMVRALVSAGADLSRTDAFGQTALDWAHELRETDPELLELLGAPNVRPARRSA